MSAILSRPQCVKCVAATLTCQQSVGYYNGKYLSRVNIFAAVNAVQI